MLQSIHVGALGSATTRFDDIEQAAALRAATVRDAGERDHDGAPLGERVALVAAQALARVALAPEQSGGFLAGACEPLAAQAAAARLGLDPAVRTDRLVVFHVAGVRLTLHRLDEFNTVGPAGVAAYWTVADVDDVVADWVAHGATAHRGPKDVSTGERLCQLLDPFGNLFCVRQELDTAPDGAS